MTVLGAARDWVDEHVDHVALQHPARLALGAFAVLILGAGSLLTLPFSSATGTRTPFVDALFTASSASTVTGLVTLDTGVHWSAFGQVVILVAIKVGGLGIMTLASLVALAVTRRLGLTSRMLAADEARAGGLGDVRTLLRTIFVVSTSVEAGISTLLFWRLLSHGEPLGRAAWHSVFYAVSAFNNAGFMPDPGGIVPYADDPVFRMSLAAALLLGATGFPVYFNLVRSWRRPRKWSLHTKLTLVTIAVLQLASILLLALFEWNNPETLGASHGWAKVWQTLFVSVNQRHGGFAGLDHGLMHEQTWLLEDVLMFIGAGSGGTAGGIRATTLAVLLLAIWAEARGRRDIEAFGKRIGTEVLRLAVAVTFVSLFFVIVGTGIVLAQTTAEGFTLGQVLFEVSSGFATVGLSTGITPHLPTSAKVTIAVIMYIGRVGSITVVAALALNRQRRVIRYPSERPLIG
ncbi:MAG: TrkH family potassium uptake protein [Demequinaceae bacterium]|nr:TrkH family potassium uptake protein [Demequinaceae bacterium]